MLKKTLFPESVRHIVRRDPDVPQYASGELPKHIISYRVYGVVEGVYGNIDEVSILVPGPGVVPSKTQAF